MKAIASGAVLLSAACVQAGEPLNDPLREVGLHGDAVVRLATAAEGASVLGSADDWTRRLSPFDRMARMEVKQDPGPDGFLAFLRKQALEWRGEERGKLERMLGAVRGRLEPLRLSLPDTIWLIKTTGRDEGAKPYTRGNAIVVPEKLAAGTPDALERLFLHELFHVASRHDPSVRDALYGIIGYERCGEIGFPRELAARQVTNPDAYHMEFCIEVSFRDQARWVTPLVLSGADRYAGGNLFNYVQFKLMVVEEQDGAFRPVVRGGTPWLLGVNQVEGFFEKIGRNTGYIIHPEETIADNFVLMVRGAGDAENPEILDALRQALSKE